MERTVTEYSTEEYQETEYVCDVCDNVVDECDALPFTQEGRVETVFGPAIKEFNGHRCPQCVTNGVYPKTSEWKKEQLLNKILDSGIVLPVMFIMKFVVSYLIVVQWFRLYESINITQDSFVHWLWFMGLLFLIVCFGYLTFTFKER